METRQVYLDHNATTPLHPEVVTALNNAMKVFGNPSSVHNFGRIARGHIEESREQVAALIGALPRRSFLLAAARKATIRSCPYWRVLRGTARASARRVPRW